MLDHISSETPSSKNKSEKEIFGDIRLLLPPAIIYSCAKFMHINQRLCDDLLSKLVAKTNVLKQNIIVLFTILEKMIQE